MKTQEKKKARKNEPLVAEIGLLEIGLFAARFPILF
jgi:hypothetical protein